MKKILLAAALIAASLNASALTGFTLDAAGTAGSVLNGSSLYETSIVTFGGSGTQLPAAACADLKATDATATFTISDIVFSITANSATPYKIYPNYLRCNTADKCKATIPTTTGMSVTLIFDETNEYAGNILVTGANLSTFPLTITKGTGAITTVVLVATGSSITVGLQNKCSLKTVKTSGASDLTDAISSSLLSKVNDELVNTTNLEVEVYTVMGVKVLTSSASSISVSGLASGFYVAKTAAGTLKFIK